MTSGEERKRRELACSWGHTGSFLHDLSVTPPAQPGPLHRIGGGAETSLCHQGTRAWTASLSNIPIPQLPRPGRGQRKGGPCLPLLASVGLRQLLLGCFELCTTPL